MAEDKKNSPAGHETVIYQLAVLKAMSGKSSEPTQTEKPSTSSEKIKSSLKVKKTVERPSTPTEYSLFRIQEIAQLSGLNDEKETQRYLFILEGQKLVTPLPEGDLTSKTWAITSYGRLAVEQFEQGA